MTLRRPAGPAISMLALVTALIASPALAQEVRGPESPQDTSNAPSPAATATPTAPGATPAASAPQGLEEIVVTARKVAENLQSVPVAVTAFSGTALQQSNVLTARDAAKLTPGLVITESPSTGTAALFTIRGQVQSDNLATLDPSVGVYVDGYYWARAYGITANLLDVQSFQTLKGPQGTLFGRNTTGGAILIQTNDPNFNGISLLASGTYGRFDQWSGTGVANVPLIDDRLAVRVAYQRNDRNGYMTDDTTGTKIGTQHDYTIRGKLLFKPTDNLSILLSGEQYRTNYLNAGYRSQYVAPTSPFNLEAGAETLGLACFADLAGCAATGHTILNNSIAAANSGDHVALNVLPRTYAKTQTYTATVTLDTFFGALKAIGGYRKVKSLADLDLDGTPIDELATRGFQDLSQYSVEVQATGKAFNNKLDFAAGVFYFHESGYDRSFSQSLPFLTQGITQFISGNINNDSQGLYGQSTYHVTDKLSLTGGVRYSVDDKRLVANNGIFSAGTFSSAAPGAAFLCNLTRCPDERHASFSGVSWTGGADYKLTPDVLLYAKASRGFRSGGENLRGTGTFPTSTLPFKPEKATSYEGGFKSEFFDRRVRLNVAGYYTTVDDIQRSSLVFDAMGNSATIISNAGKATFYGGEAEADALLFGGFRLAGTVAYTHPKYNTYLSPDAVPFDKRHERFALVAKWTASVSPSFEHDFDFGKFSVRGDFTYQSKTPLYNNGYYTDSSGVTHDASNGSVVDAADAAAYLKSSTDPAGWVVNGRAAMAFGDGKYEVAVWGKNLFDRRDLVVALPIGALEEVSAIRREPRTVGVTATIKFNGL